MQDRVQAVVRHVVVRLAEIQSEEIQVRYDLGEVLCTLRRVMPGPARAAELSSIAKWMRVHPSALRRYARVAETIDRMEFAQLRMLRTARGTALTWSHVEHLAQQRDRERRKTLAAAVADHDLSVREVADRLRRERNANGCLPGVDGRTSNETGHDGP